MISILFQATKDDIPFLPYLKPLLSGKAQVYVNTQDITMAYEVVMTARGKGVTRVATTSYALLKSLLGEIQGKISLDDYAGSIIDYQGIEFLILNPLEHLRTVTYGKFLFERYLRKFLKEEEWLPIPKFAWKLFDPADTDTLLDLFASSTFIAVDIETVFTDRAITCIGFSGVHINSKDNSFTITTIVVPFTDMYSVTFARCILRLSTPKCFQNGKYDNAYLLRFNCPGTNWSFDTINMFHSWYSELPKRLDFITSFMLRKSVFWKKMFQPGEDINVYYEYNARDCFNTALSWLALTRECPDYAWNNYLQEFPLVFPCLTTELTGIRINDNTQAALKIKVEAAYDRDLQSIRKMVASPGYNPGSWQQNQKLFVVLGSQDIKETGKIGMDRVMARHPLNKVIISKIAKYKVNRKLAGSYVSKEFTWNGRCYYNLNPSGTDSGRLASQESHFWCGIQIQNIPTDKPEIKVKDMFEADPGFFFGECDYSKNETWGTAFLSGDPNLLRNIQDETKDFHGTNASKFFGVAYERIVNSYWSEEFLEWVHDTIDKILRDLSKRTNHGANYNMGPGVLLDTMGIENVLRAKRILGLPNHWSLLKVTGYLLEQFNKEYKIMKGPWYDKCRADATAGYLVGPTGWTRRCFGDTKNKHWFNSYVAHPPQSLGAMQLNLGYRRVFQEIWIENSSNFKLGPQIHDSIIFQYRCGFEDLAWRVKECMNIPIDVRDTFGVVRRLQVPSDLKGGAVRWSEIKPLHQQKLAA